MGQYFCAQSHGNTLGSLCQQQRIFCRQGHRFLVTAVVREFPFGGLGIEKYVECKLCQASFDVTWRGSLVTCEDVSPRSLAVDEQVLASHLRQGVDYRGIAMGVELHGFACNVRHLVVTAVVHAFHGVEYAPLHRFQTVAHMGDGTLKDDVRGIVEKPVLVHPCQRVRTFGADGVGTVVVCIWSLQFFRFVGHILMRNGVVFFFRTHLIYKSSVQI